MESRPLDSAEERMSLDVLSVIPKDEVTGIVDITQILRPEGLSGNRKIIVAVFFLLKNGLLSNLRASK